MHLRDTSDSFGLFSILFHWVSAGLIIGIFILGQVMEDMARGPAKRDLLEVHQSFGLLLLLLVLVRLIWRLSQGFPRPAAPTAAILNVISRLWHWALLILIIAIPVSGFIASDAGRSDLHFFGLFVLPDIIGFDHDLHEQFEDIHGALTTFLIPLVAIHVAAAFKHHFWNRDATLKRMLGIK